MRSADHSRRSVSRMGQANGTRTTSIRGSTRSSRDGSAPVNRSNTSRSTVSTVTSQPSAANALAVASAR